MLSKGLSSDRLNLLWHKLSNSYYHIAPKWFRKIIGPALERQLKFFYRVYRIVNDLFPKVAEVQFCGTSDEHFGKLLLAGAGDSATFLMKRLPLQLPTSLSRRAPLTNICRRFGSSASVILIEGDRCYSDRMKKDGLLAIPEWVRFKMDISKSMDDIVKNWKEAGGRDNLRKINKYDFTCEVTQSLAQLAEFYHQMYLPYIQSRFGGSALVASFGHMRGLLENGTLLLLKNQTGYFAGNLMYEHDSCPRAAFLAIKDANVEYLKQGAISALYYHSIVWAKSKGYSLMDFGHCRPLLSDGLFHYKKRWGMYIEKSDEKHRMLYLSMQDSNAGWLKFLRANPLVCEHEGKLQGLIFCRSEDTLPANIIKRLEAKYHIPGLEGLRFVLVRS